MASWSAVELRSNLSANRRSLLMSRTRQFRMLASTAPGIFIWIIGYVCMHTFISDLMFSFYSQDSIPSFHEYGTYSYTATVRDYLVRIVSRPDHILFSAFFDDYLWDINTFLYDFIWRRLIGKSWRYELLNTGHLDLVARRVPHWVRLKKQPRPI